MEGRNVLYAVVRSELLQLLVGGVDGGEDHVLVLGGHLVVEGRDHLALAAPRRVEVHHQLLRAVQQLLEVLLVAHLHHIGAHQVLVLLALRRAAAEVLQAVVALRVDRLLAGLPVRRAHLAVLRHELERLHQTQRLVHAAAHREVVHRDVLDHALRVDDEQAAESDAQILRLTPLPRTHVVQNAVLRGDLLRVVADDGDLHVAQTALLAGSLDPRQVRLHRIARAGDQLRVDLAELLSAVAEGDDLSGAHEGEILGVEEQHHVFSCDSELGPARYPCSPPDSRW